MRLIHSAALALILALAAPGAALGDRVTVLDGPGLTHLRNDPFLTSTPEPPPPWDAISSSPASAKYSRVNLGPSIPIALAKLRDSSAISAAEYASRIASYNKALRSRDTLSGTRRQELQSVLNNTDFLASSGRLIASRLPAVFLTLDRNREWWTSGTLLHSGDRISFKGSPLIFQYYPGEGVQLQVLANFGRANGLWEGGFNDSLRELLYDLLPLAAKRGGGIAWEYYFHFGGGRPPWVSGMAQGTAIQALSRAAVRLSQPAYLEAAKQALPLFSVDAPTGVRVRIGDGVHYALYSFAPEYRVINGFLQALVGLHDMATIGQSKQALALFEIGDREARRELPNYNTGSWSMYDQVSESDLAYHELVTGFLTNLCTRTATPLYCSTATAFTRYEHQPPKLALITSHAKPGSAGRLYFRVSKVSRVSMTVQRGKKVFLSTSAKVSGGSHFYTWKAPAGRGTATVRMTATDLAGNRYSTTALLPIR
ncbi:MAG: D-glucuronyl C5-epimerase family protein [Solirubrobacterales bacterium]|nr:D-glucuronyl C5-epimerase family protein [Solirubrobacterales bacterium]